MNVQTIACKRHCYQWIMYGMYGVRAQNTYTHTFESSIVADVLLFQMSKLCRLEKLYSIYTQLESILNETRRRKAYNLHFNKTIVGGQSF